MPDLHFRVQCARVVPYAVTPHLAIDLEIESEPAGMPIQSVVLQCQVRIEAPKRRYSAEEEVGLLELFGERERWGQTLKGFLWAHSQVVAPEFEGTTRVELPLACTFDFNVASAKYLSALKSGSVPLILLFSGSVFYQDATGALRVERIPWSKEATFELPVEVWMKTREHYFPNTAVLTLERPLFNRLTQFKQQGGFPTFDGAVEQLLERAQ